MKKLFALLTALALMLSLASCGGQKSDPENDAENIQNEQTDSNEQEDTTPEETTPEETAPEETEPGTDEEAQMPEEQPDEQPAPEEETPQAPEGITLSRTDFTLFTQGSTYRLKVSGAKDPATFTSSNPAVATVAEDGTVTAVAPGTSQITVTAGDHTATCVVRCRWEKPAAEKPEEKPEEKPADNTSSGSVDLQAFYDDMTSTYEFQALQAFSGEILDSYYAGMSDVDTKQCLIMGTMMSMNNGEFCLVEVTNSSDVETVKAILQSRVDYMAESGAWYPGPTELWTNSSRVVSNGNYVMMVVHENCDDIVDAFNEYCS